MVFLHAREIIHSLELVDYLHIQMDNPCFNYYSFPSLNERYRSPGTVSGNIATDQHVSNSLVIVCDNRCQANIPNKQNRNSKISPFTFTFYSERSNCHKILIDKGTL